jgi:ATP-dependent Lhr-like helicase
MARPETALIEIGADRSLMLGKTGERVVTGHDFYAVFTTTEEFRVVAEGKTIGTIPIDQTLAPGQTIIFSGRRWKILSIDTKARLLEVKATHAALPPRFGGDFSGVHDRVAETMRTTLAETDVPVFLDGAGRELLEEGRSAYFDLGLDRTAALQSGRDCALFPWVGSTKLDTFALALMSRGFEASVSGHIIEVTNCNSSDVLSTLREIAASPHPAGDELAEHAAKLHREKYDHFLPDELLKAALAKERLDPASVPGVARRILNPAG